MESKVDEGLITQVMSLVDTFQEAAQYLTDCVHDYNFSQAFIIVLDDTIALSNVMNDFFSQNFSQSYIKNYWANLAYSFSKVKQAVSEENFEDAHFSYLIECEGLIGDTLELVRFEMVIKKEPKLFEEYRLANMQTLTKYKEFLSDYEKPDCLYEVSIVFLAYNHLDYTRRAMESIFKYTDFSKGNVELITINNGSSDGTGEYFDSLPHKKKINLKENVNIAGAQLGIYCSEGKYLVLFSNDVLATQNWMDNLLACIKSDPDIGLVVPVCNNSSNLQTVPTTYGDDMNKMQEFAQGYNVSNPLLWEERPRLIPFIAISYREFYTCGYKGDPIYTKALFSDDDTSTMLRRLGIKQVLAKDTFMHHYGSITLKSDSTNENYEQMRRGFYNKWGVDAWESLAINTYILDSLQRVENITSDRMLAIEPRFAGTPLHIKNILKSRGSFVNEMWAIYSDGRYREDVNAIFDTSLLGEDYIEMLRDCTEFFSIIVFCLDLDEYIGTDIDLLVKSAYDRLATDGMLLISFKNPYFLGVSIQILCGKYQPIRYPSQLSHILQIIPQKMIDNIRKYTNVQVTYYKADISISDSAIQTILANIDSTARELCEVEKIVLLVQKNK